MERAQPLESVVMRFAGDSGDGIQLTGGQFTLSTALAGNALATFPDLMAGFSVSALQRIAAAPPDKRGAMFLTSAWTPCADGIPKGAKPLQ